MHAEVMTMVLMATLMLLGGSASGARTLLATPDSAAGGSHRPPLSGEEARSDGWSHAADACAAARATLIAAHRHYRFNEAEKARGTEGHAPLHLVTACIASCSDSSLRRECEQLKELVGDVTSDIQSEESCPDCPEPAHHGAGRPQDTPYNTVPEDYDFYEDYQRFAEIVNRLEEDV